MSGPQKTIVKKQSQHPQPSQQSTARKYAMFNSRVGGARQALSNFATVPGGIPWKDGRRYASAEAIYQLCKVDPSDHARFALDGDLGSLEKGLPQLYKPSKLEGAIKYWGAKQPTKTTRNAQLEMSGIIQKMAVNPKHSDKLKTPLKLTDMVGTPLSDAKLVAKFCEIWRAKWDASSAFREALRNVPRDVRLVEFSRGAKRESEAGRPPRWTALVDKETGVLFGQNLAGRGMDAFRRELGLMD